MMPPVHRRSVLLGLLASVPAISSLRAQTTGDPTAAATGGAQAGQSATVLRNVRIFDGQSAQLVAGTVLVAGDRIADIQAGDIVPPEGATVIDG